MKKYHWLLGVLAVAFIVPSVSEAELFGRWRKNRTNPKKNAPTVVNTVTYDNQSTYHWPNGTFTFENESCSHGSSCTSGEIGSGNTCRWEFTFYGDSGMRFRMYDRQGNMRGHSTKYTLWTPDEDGDVEIHVPCYSDDSEFFRLTWNHLSDTARDPRLTAH